MAGTDHEFTVAHETLPELFVEGEEPSSLSVTHLTDISYTSGSESCAEYIVKDSLIGWKSGCCWKTFEHNFVYSSKRHCLQGASTFVVVYALKFSSCQASANLRTEFCPFF